MSEEKPYEIWHDGKPLTEVMPNDLLILRNTNIDPKMAEILPQTRVLFLSSEVEAIVVRDWENKHNVGIDPKAVEWR